MTSRRLVPSIEILESRIAPAQFFVNSSSGIGALTVQTATGANAQDTPAENSAQAVAGSTAAVLLHAGDSLIFDANNDHKFDTGDSVLLKLSAGKAMVFLTGTGAFTKTDITGLAVSNGFNGSLTNDIHGSVVTALDSSGNFTAVTGTLTIEHSAIAGLTTPGQIAGGSVLAGASITGLTVNNAPTALSVDGMIATGSAASGMPGISFNGGGTAFTTQYTATPGQNGGNISHVSLADGTLGIMAGAGAAITNGAAGTGGSIEFVTVKNSPQSFSIQAGNGGASDNASGAGGSLAHLNITEQSTSSDAIDIAAGTGATSATNAGGTGGAGGSIAGLRLSLPDAVDILTIQSGDGGGAGTSGAGHGGAGGLIDGVSVSGPGVANFTLEGGSGGQSGANKGIGGVGGGIVNPHLALTAGNQDQLLAGNGGSGFTGAAGGSIVGAIVRSGIPAVLPKSSAWQISGGNGGSGSGTLTPGGAGGSIRGGAFEIALSTVNIQGGAGGDAVTENAGTGGKIAGVDFTNPGATTGAVGILGGAGGSLSDANGRGFRAGTGGLLAHVVFTNEANGSVGGFQLSSGNGGDILSGQGSAGNSGLTAHVDIRNFGDVTANGDIRTGQGGIVDGTGNGGNSGRVVGVEIHDTFGAANPFEIYAGVPVETFAANNKNTISMNGSGAGAKGGNIGTVSKVHFEGAANTHIIIGQSDQGSGTPGQPNSTEAMQAAGAGGTGVEAKGGLAGNIYHITGEGGTLDIAAPGGGTAATGTGGLGSSVLELNIHGFAHLIAAGNGGDGGVAGSGGSVRHVRVAGHTGDAGSIGSFTETFGLTTDATVMGGLVAGVKGTGSGTAINGRVVYIVADRIAAILAGRPAANGITDADAPTLIGGIDAHVIGADNGITGMYSQPGGSGGTFSWDGVPTFTAATISQDTAIDGFVLGQKGKVVLPVRPLDLVLV